MSLSPSKNIMLKQEYPQVRFVKSLFINIQKQQNMLKISLLYKKFTNFMEKELENS